MKATRPAKDMTQSRIPISPDPTNDSIFRSRYVLVLFLLWALWLALEHFAFGPLSYVRSTDNGDSSLPAHISATHMHFSFWAEQWASGADRNAQYCIEGLLLPFMLLPGWLAYGAIMFAQRFIAGYFSFRLASEHLNMAPWPGLFSALSFSLFFQPSQNGSTGFTLYDGFGLPAIPLVLWLLGRAARTKLSRAVCYATIAGALLGVASHLVLSIFIAPLVLIWFALVDVQKSPRFWAVVALFGVIWCALSLPLIIGVLANGPLSPRSHIDFSKSTFSAPVEWIGQAVVLVKDNWLPLLLAMVAYAFTGRRSRNYRILLILTLLCLCSDLLYHLALRVFEPNTHGFNIDRFYTLVPFLAAMLGGMSADALITGYRIDLTAISKQSRGTAVGTALAFVACLVIIVQSIQMKAIHLDRMISGQNYRAFYQNPDLLELAASTSAFPRYRVATIAAGRSATFHPAFLWVYNFDTVDGYLSLYTNRYHEFWEQVEAPLFAVDIMRHDYFYDWGGRIYLYTPSSGFPACGEAQFSRYYNLSLLSLEGVRYIISPTPVEDPQLNLLPSSARNHQLAWERLPRYRRLLSYVRGAYPGIPLYIYENADALPRYFLSHHVIRDGDSAHLLQAMSRSSVAALASTVFVSSEALGIDEMKNDAGYTLSGSVRATKWIDDRREFVINSDSESILVITSNFSPYWKARVDDKPAPIMPVDHAFIGIEMPPGHHSATLTYEPPLASVRY